MAPTSKDDDGGPHGFLSSCRMILSSSWVNIFLLAMPVPYLITGSDPLWWWIGCFLSTIPLLKILDFSMANLSCGGNLTFVGLSSGAIFEQLIAFHAIYRHQPEVALPLALGSSLCGILVMTGFYILIFNKYLASESSYRAPVVYYNLGIGVLGIMVSLWTYWQDDRVATPSGLSLVISLTLATSVLLGSVYIYGVQLHRQSTQSSLDHGIHPKGVDILAEFKRESMINSSSTILSLMLCFGMMIPTAAGLLDSTVALLHGHVPFCFAITVFLPLVIRFAVLLPSIHSAALTESALLTEIRRGMNSMIVHFPISFLAAAMFGNPIAVVMHAASSLFLLFAILLFWILHAQQHAQQEERVFGFPPIALYAMFTVTAAAGAPG